MSAVISMVDFKLPKKPKVVEKEAPPDQRSFAVVPLRALRDKRLTSGDIRVLGIMASYANRAGLTWVGQKRMGEDLQVSQQAISKHLKRLTEMGYIEVVSQAFRGEKACTRRIVFDDKLTAQDAVSIVSPIEDARSPEMIKKDQKPPMRPGERLADDGLPEMSEEQIQRNRKRLRELLATVATDKTGVNHREFNMPKSGVTKAVAEARQKVARRRPHTQHQGCESEAVHTQPLAPKSDIHTQPDTQPQSCANTETMDIDGYKGVFINNGFKCLHNDELFVVLSECMSPTEAESMLELVTARYHAEGLHLPSNLAVVIEDMIATHAARHLEASQRAS